MYGSPLNSPNGTNRRRYNWNSYMNANGRDCQAVNNSSYHCLSSQNDGMQVSGEDFIPLNISIPITKHKKHVDNWYSPSDGGRNNTSRGCNFKNHFASRFNYNNSYSTSRSSCNNSYSPYKRTGMQFHGQRKNYKGATHRQINISEYMNISSFLEDPWENLIKKLNNSKDTSESKNNESLANIKLVDSGSIEKSEDNFQRNVILNDSQYSQEINTASSVDVSFETENTDISQISKTNSLIDLEVGSICFDQNLLNVNTCGKKGNISKATEEKDTHSDELMTNIDKKNV